MSDRTFVHDMKNYLGIVIGYAWMLWLAQLPDDERVLVPR